MDELVLRQAADKIFDIDSIYKQNSTVNFTFKRLDNNVLLFNLKFSEETSIPAVPERGISMFVYHILV